MSDNSDREENRNTEIAASVVKVMGEIAKDWKKEKRHADRNDRVSYYSLRRMRSGRTHASIRDVAFRVMEAAYKHASGNGRYYANARQIMYAARPLMLEKEPSLDLGGGFSIYFTQTILKDYLEERNPGWKIVWDARGHLVEPYTGESVGLGGLEVMKYIEGWNDANFEEYPKPSTGLRVKTSGPVNRFASVLFIEKEGFAEILKDAEIGRKYDLALMSTKGLPVKAACDLANAFAGKGVRIFVLHDFDLAGFKIVKTLREGTRMAEGTDVVDLGLRLGDVGDLESEPVEYSQGKDPREYLGECGATEEEQAFLVEGRSKGWHGRRVEINAMTSDQLVFWLKRKFKEHGVKKVIPHKDTLARCYRRARYVQWIEEQIKEMENEKRTRVPSDLEKRVAAALRKEPATSWDTAVWSIAGGDPDRDEDDEDAGLDDERLKNE